MEVVLRGDQFLTGMAGFSISRPAAGFLWFASFVIVKEARKYYTI
jgi:hypothetical protein